VLTQLVGKGKTGGSHITPTKRGRRGGRVEILEFWSAKGRKNPLPMHRQHGEKKERKRMLAKWKRRGGKERGGER